MKSHSFSARLLFTSSAVAVAVAFSAGGSGCSPAADDKGLVGAAPATTTCGNGVLDPDETCDSAIASGASACPASCDDGNACTADTLSGEGCTAACAHAPVTACTSGDGCCAKGCSSEEDSDCVEKCGDGIVSGGETCDTAIKGGAGACPTSCSSANACSVPQLQGSGCQATCVTTTIGIPKPGDGCCPAGATRATDSDCPGAYGDTCTLGAQCTSGLCLPNVMCTKNCTLAGAVNQCGRPGDFCFESVGGSPFCYPLVNTGADTDDKYIGIGTAYPARLDSGTDLDAFVADLQVGTYALLVTPTDAPSQIDVVVDIYDGGANKVGTVNSGGIGLAEGGDYTVSAASRSFFVVRAANALQGNYTIRLDKKP
jgi:hypothetical protein